MLGTKAKQMMKTNRKSNVYIYIYIYRTIRGGWVTKAPGQDMKGPSLATKGPDRGRTNGEWCWRKVGAGREEEGGGGRESGERKEGGEARKDEGGR